MSAQVVLSPDEHRWILTGHRVTQIAVDETSVRFQTWTLQASAEVRIGAPFTLREADGVERRIDPEAPEQLAPLLSLLGRAVEVVVLSRSGHLELGFGDGSTIGVAPHPRINAWELQGGGAFEGMAYRCDPGGGTPWK